ncbi:AtpZ/AtpI family protein [Sphingobacterium arenae]|uniref:AtpZ/AtpI family protein n=1 Tax=Sphingobacterium arenae TaxID=1280598 RepID=A0ABR7Y725_9SPHI|nr:AtpZ/AtpI family protein [Sphingobacterium arenae]MBD1427101.1 AtpZ/AtpI family protein [Sphingobacterium arenae]
MKTNTNRKRMAAWIGVPFQMLATIFAGYWLGSWLDEKYAVEKSWWTIGLTLFAVLISLYQLVVQVQRMGKNKSNN